MIERGRVSLENVAFLTLDEADRMLVRGPIKEMRCWQIRQRLHQLFGADRMLVSGGGTSRRGGAFLALKTAPFFSKTTTLPVKSFSPLSSEHGRNPFPRLRRTWASSRPCARSSTRTACRRAR